MAFMTSRIYEVKRIGSGTLSVMAKPVAGEDLDDELRAIARSGTDRIVSLLERSEAFEVGLRDEQHVVERHGMAFESYPIPDRGLPASVGDFGKFTRHLHDEAASGKGVVVHCRAGIGRTGLVAAGVLLHCGLTPADAFARVSGCRGVEVPDTDEQRDWLRTNVAAIVQSGGSQ